jgi:hypothetical protein
MAIFWRLLVTLAGFAPARYAAVAVAAWFAAGIHADIEAAKARAALRTAQAAELAREQEASRRLAADATARAADDALTARALQDKIDEMRRFPNVQTVNLPPLAAPPCAIDSAFLGRVRDFDAVARTPAPAARAR